MTSPDRYTSPMPESISRGRYRLVRPLGRGGFGAVYEGIDQLTGQAVAVKLMGEEYGKELAYRWREAALLRLLQLPGVVQLIEEGQDGDTTYLVMELVQGEPFPGYAARGDWTKVEAPLRQLLSTLERVHLEGIVHRDLKPHNVLVRADGSVVLLDFGLSLDPNLAASLTSTPSRIVGTPAYLAPEQWRSEPVSRQTDLWAVGIMLYEALCGSLPFSATNMIGMMRGALGGVSDLRALPDDAPPHVAWFLRRLLAASPHDRPTSAGDALRLLDGEGSASQRHMMPLLGRQDALDAALGHLFEGRAVCFSGPPGSGRTRMLQEVREALGRQGRFTLRLWPADEPYGSLRELGLRGDEARVQLSAALDEGMIVLCEDLEGLDPAARALLSARLPAHPALIARAPRGVGAAEVALPALDAHTLLRLFGGHERIVRTRSGGAQELLRRTGGNAAKVAREVEGWTRAKLARWHGDLLVLEPDALPKLRAGLQLSEATTPRPVDTLEERIQAWLYLTQPVADSALLSDLLSAEQSQVEQHLSALVEQGHIQRDAQGEVFVHKAAWMDEVLSASTRESAHLSIAAALPAGHPKRLYHMVAAGQSGELVDELLAQALAWDAQGLVSRALVTLSDAVRQARTHHSPLDEAPLLLAAARIALASGTKRDLERLLYEVESSTAREALGAYKLEALIHGALDAMQRPTVEVLARLEALGANEDVGLELRRCQWIARLGWAQPVEEAAARLAQIVAWAAATGDEDSLGTAQGWEAMLWYRQHQFARAAAQHEESAKRKRRPTARLASLLNAVLCYENALEYERALALAEQAEREAARCEHVGYELAAVAAQRLLRYRLGELLEVDDELLEFAATRMDMSMLCQLLAADACSAWRRGELERAGELAQRLIRSIGDSRKEIAVLGAALRYGMSDEGAPPAKLLEEITQMPAPRLLVQALGMVARRHPLTDDLKTLMLTHRDAVPPDAWHKRLEFLSFAEAFGYAGITMCLHGPLQPSS